MRDYGKIAPTFWTRGSGKRLRGDAIAQAIAVYLCTAPASNMIGLFHIGLPTIAHETGHAVDDVRKALERIAAAGFAKFDEEHDLVFIPNAAEYQIGDSLKPTDKRIPGVARELRGYGDHPFVTEFVTRYGVAFGLTDQAPSAQQEAPFRRPEGPPARARDSAPAPAPASDQGGVGGATSSPPPADIPITERVRLDCFAAGARIPSTEDALACLANARKKGFVRADWEAELVSWMIKDKGFAKANGGGPVKASGKHVVQQSTDEEAPWEKTIR